MNQNLEMILFLTTDEYQCKRMKNKKKSVLILGGSSDIGVVVVKNFSQLEWKITAHFFKNKTSSFITGNNCASSQPYPAT